MFGGCYSPGVCSVLLLLVVVMATLPSLFISSQFVASLQRKVKKYEKVSILCSSGVVRV